MVINWKKKVKQNEEELCSGIILSERFKEQKESRFYTLLLKGILVYLLVGGGMGCFLSAINITYSVWSVQLFLFLASLFCALLYHNIIWENIGYLILLFSVGITAMGLRNYVNSGFYAVLNDFSELSAGYFETNAMKSYGEQIENRSFAITISMCVVGLVVCILVNIVVSRKMLYGLILIVALGFLFMPLYLERHPDILFQAMLVTGIFLCFIWHGTLYRLIRNDQEFLYKKKRKDNVYQFAQVYHVKWMRSIYAAVLGVVFVVTAGTAVLLPGDNYNEIAGESELKTQTKDTFSNLALMGLSSLFNRYPSTAGMNSGKLGGISAVNLDYNTDLKVVFAPYSYDRIYLKTFTGAEYYPYQNSWNRGVEASIEEKEYVEGKKLKKAYEKENKYSAKALIEIENVAAASGEYVPYYISDAEKSKILAPKEHIVYTYYPWFQENQVKIPVDSIQKEDWLSVPEENKEQIEAFCKEAKLSGTPEQIIAQVTNYYQENIPYTYRPGATPYRKDFVNFFLTENRKGYCVHFASAATLIFRQMGIPARYVEGYAIDYQEVVEEGKLLRDKSFQDYYKGYSSLGETGVISLEVTDASAHAWVEVYLDGKGWQVVEVTPYSEEAEQLGFWNFFVQMIGGEQGDMTSTEDLEKIGGDAIDFEEGTRYIRLVLLPVIFLVIAILLLRKCISIVQEQRKYQISNRSDKLILRYQKMVASVVKVYPEFLTCQNYREQLEWCKEYLREDWLQKEENRLLAVLQRAGFSNQEINQEDLEYGLQSIQKMKEIISRKNVTKKSRKNTKTFC